ncbi:hypothetical protein T484DRAFT_1922216, partial [Baffinella frigidus]
VGSTPLHLAATNGNAGAIGLLLEAGADREAKDDGGNAVVTVGFVLREGLIAEVLGVRQDGKTPLDLAIANGEDAAAARLRR